MKTLRSILCGLALSAISISPLLANTNSNPSLEPENLRNQIREHVPFPEFAKSWDYDSQVEMSFKIHPDGEIEVLQVSGPDLSLNRYVKQQMSELKLAKKQPTEQVYTIILTFKRI